MTQAIPVERKNRIRSIDTLRGIALLGILLLNIIAFSGPLASYYNPSAAGSIEGINLLVAMFVDVSSEGAFRAIFSMLFGAGVLIFFAKPEAASGVVRSLYYRRTWLLIGFGLFNAYLLLWVGDILYAYGVTGLLLYFFKDLTAKKLALSSLCLFLFLGLIHTSSYLFTRSLYNAFTDVSALPIEIEKSDDQNQILRDWESYMEQQLALPGQIQMETELRRRGYIDNFKFTAQINIFFQTVNFLINTFWDAAAMMLMGMAFMKWRIFDASRDLGFYVKFMIYGFGVGLSVNCWEAITYVQGGFKPFWVATLRPTYDLGRLGMAIGYIGAVMTACKLEILPRLLHSLACVGQMALTNYLAQSIICNIIFLGFGFGMFGKMNRVEIYAIVVAIWIFQIIFSVFWLKLFLYGPAEWLWRSLTYKQAQPLKLRPD
jgi:uncharacterized protein